MGMIFLGRGIRFTRLAWSTIDVVPFSHAMVKKLYGTSPQSANKGKLFISLFGKTTVKINVSVVIITSGFNRDHRTPNDMLRYRMRKSLKTRLSRRKKVSPRHMLVSSGRAASSEI